MVTEWHTYSNQMTELNPGIPFITTFPKTFVRLNRSTLDLCLIFYAYISVCSQILKMMITNREPSQKIHKTENKFKAKQNGPPNR